MIPSFIRRMFPLLVLTAGVLGAAATMPGHAQSIQKWVDDKGKVHFGDMPPPDANATSLKLKVAPPSEPPKPAQPSAKKPDAVPGKAGAAKTAPDEDRRAVAAAVKSRSAEAQKATECSKRRAAIQREVAARGAFAQRGSQGGGEAAFDAHVAKENAWIAQNCQ